MDSHEEYTLLLMHWIAPNSGACRLAVQVNGQWSTVLYVDATEGQGGQNNVTAVELRNTTFTTINYHDYLRFGLNEIAIVVEPVTPGAGNQYTLFALAIGEA